MAKEEAFAMQGKVLEALANAQFRVKLDQNDYELICHIAGKMRKNFIKIIPGDDVTIEISPYDMTKGRIVYRGRPRPKYAPAQTQVQHRPHKKRKS